MGPNLTEIGAKAFDGWESGWDGIFTIQGYEGTYAEQWAKDNSYPFESLGAAPAAPATPTTPTTPATPAASGTFSDVPAGAYFADAVQWAVENEITKGTDASHFSPNAGCTRAQAITFLWRAAGCPAPDSGDNPFVDVAAGEYYNEAVLWAAENGVTSGTDSTHFSPNAICTRAQIVTFLWQFERGALQGNAVNPFVDMPGYTWYTDAVLWAYHGGITSGTDATHFSPSATCTRGQIVTFLYRDMA